MTDTRTVWTPDTGRGDWSLSGAQLASGSDLETAVLLSLFTDREALPDDVVPDGTGDRRGWWGGEIGSRLWLLERAKQTPETLARARDYAAEALQWLIDDGVVAAFDIQAEWSAPGRLGMRVVAYKAAGGVEAMNYAWTWQGI